MSEYQKSNTGVVNIRGKKYRTVGLRVNEFRDKHPAASGWAIHTQIVECSERQAVVRACIVDSENRLLATGHAQETWDSSQVNSTSALENAETSAIGRALAAFGLGGEEFASADEVATAIQQQSVGHTNKPASPEEPPFDVRPRVDGDTVTHTQREWQTQIAGLSTMEDLALFLDSGPLATYYNEASEWEQVLVAASQRLIELDTPETSTPEDRGAVLTALQGEETRLLALKSPKLEAPTNADATPTPDKPKRRGRPPKNAAA